jgi:hypothetical protein
MLHKSQDPDNTSDWRNSCFEIHSSDLLRSKRNKEGRLYFKATSGECDAPSQLDLKRLLL